MEREKIKNAILVASIQLTPIAKKVRAVVNGFECNHSMMIS